MQNSAHRNLFRFSIFVILYIGFVIVWGAYVRATGSGAGCGSHWPLCNGQIIPRIPSIQTQIEYFHRLSSGLSLIFVLGLSILVFKNFSKGQFARQTAGIASVSIIMEALIGAGLVLLELVSHDQSVKRTVSIALHFTNTLILLGSLSFLAVSLRRNGEGTFRGPSSIRNQAVGLTVCFFLLGMAGSITALGDTLFPAQSLAEGFSQDLRASSHFLIKLRAIHPALALLFASISIPWISSGISESSFNPQKNWGKLLIGLIITNLLLGLLNLFYLAPLGLQMLHLTVALCVWVAWIIWIDFLRLKRL